MNRSRRLSKLAKALGRAWWTFENPHSLIMPGVFLVAVVVLGARL
jgi:hypothetical protein